MSEVISTVFSIIIVLGVTIGPLISIVHNRRVIRNTYDKSIIYLASELSFSPKEWGQVKKKIDYEKPKNISIPFKTIATGMYGQPLSAFGQIGIIWYGLLFLATLFILGIINTTPLKPFASDLMDIFMVLGLGLCWFIYNFRSFSVDIGRVIEKSDITLGFLLDLGWEAIDEDVVDILEKEVRIDFELYRKETSINGLFLLLASSVLLFYSKISTFASEKETALFIFILASAFISKWLYETHRSHLIEIALNAILGLKKNIRLQKLQSL